MGEERKTARFINKAFLLVESPMPPLALLNLYMQ